MRLGSRTALVILKLAVLLCALSRLIYRGQADLFWDKVAQVLCCSGLSAGSCQFFLSRATLLPTQLRLQLSLVHPTRPIMSLSSCSQTTYAFINGNKIILPSHISTVNSFKRFRLLLLDQVGQKNSALQNRHCARLQGVFEFLVSWVQQIRSKRTLFAETACGQCYCVRMERKLVESSCRLALRISASLLEGLGLEVVVRREEKSSRSARACTGEESDGRQQLAELRICRTA